MIDAEGLRAAITNATEALEEVAECACPKT